MNSSEMERWLPTLNNNPNADVRLFCLPYAGSSSLVFKSWPESAPDFVEICPVEYPGRGRRLTEPPIYQISPLVDNITEVIYKCNDKPFTLFGHSMGGIVSYEVTKKLRQDFNINPIHLFISAHRAPHLQKDEEDMMYNLPEPEFLAKLRDLNGMPKEVLEHQELMEMLLPILRADFTLCETYMFAKSKPVNCPITVFGGENDESVPPNTLEPWKEHTTSSFDKHILPGDHFFIFSSYKILLNIIIKELNKCLVKTLNYF